MSATGQVIFCFKCDRECAFNAAYRGDACSCGHSLGSNHGKPKAALANNAAAHASKVSKLMTSSSAATSAQQAPVAEFRQVQLRSTGIAVGATSPKHTPMAAPKTSPTTAPAPILKSPSATSNTAAAAAPSPSTMASPRPNSNGVIPFEQTSQFQRMKQQFGAFLRKGQCKKKSRKNRHRWQSRFCVLFEKSFLYWHEEKDCATNPSGIVSTGMIEKVVHATKGEGSDIGARFNLECAGGVSYEWIVEGAANPRADAKDWVDKFQRSVDSFNKRPLSATINALKSPASPPPQPQPQPQASVIQRSSLINTTIHGVTLRPTSTMSPPPQQPQQPKPQPQLQSARANDITNDDAPDGTRFSLAGKKILMEGALAKKSTASRHLWQKRWFVLTPEFLLYYKTRDERLSGQCEPAKVILTPHIKSLDVPSAGKGTDEGLRFNLDLHLSSRIFELMAETHQMQAQWVAEIRKITQQRDAKAQALKDQQLQAEKERAALVAKADAERLAAKERMAAQAQAERERLRREHQARAEKEAAELRAAHAAKEAELKRMAERANKERAEQIARLEAQRKRVLETQQKARTINAGASPVKPAATAGSTGPQAANTSPSNNDAAAAKAAEAAAAAERARIEAAHAAELERIRQDLLKQKSEALAQARLEQEAILQAERAADQAKLQLLAQQVEAERQAAEAKAKQAYQTQAAAMRLAFEKEKAAERAAREREQQENERKIITAYERELAERKAEIVKGKSIQRDEAPKLRLGPGPEIEADEFDRLIAEEQVKAERDARLKLEAELVALQEKQERQQQEEERAANLKREKQAAALKDQFKNELAREKEKLEQELKQEQIAREKKEEELRRAAQKEKEELTKQLEEMARAKAEAEAKAREAELAASQRSASVAKPAIDPAELEAQQEQMRQLAEDMAMKAAALRIAEQVESMRLQAKAEEEERARAMKEADEKYQQELQAVNAKLNEERQALRKLQSEMEKKVAAAMKPRILPILREGDLFALGMIEVAAPAGEKTLAEIRAIMCDEIDELADDFVFLLKNDDGQTQLPLSRKQESKKLLGDLAPNEPILVRMASTAAPVASPASPGLSFDNAVVVPPAAPPMAPPSAPDLSSTLSPTRASMAIGAPRADLLSSIRAGASLKKTELVERQPTKSTNGLSGLLSAAMASRRVGVNQEEEDDDEAEGRKRADSWDFLE